MGLKDELDESPMNVPPVLYTLLIAGLAVFTLVLTYVSYSLFHGWYGLSIDFGSAWDSKGRMIDGLVKVWPMFAWGTGITLLTGIIAVVKRIPRDHEPGYVFAKGTWISLNAGFFEEIIYRWLLFFGAMFFIKLFDVLTFGLVHWFYTEVTIPFTNWITFGLLEPQLHSPYGWLFAAAIISANGKFKEQHEYLGLFGWVNAWFLGMVLFYLVFNYGLWTAIVAHIIYDLCVFWTRAGVSVFQPKRSTYLFDKFLDSMISDMFRRGKL